METKQKQSKQNERDRKKEKTKSTNQFISVVAHVCHMHEPASYLMNQNELQRKRIKTKEKNKKSVYSRVNSARGKITRKKKNKI